MARDILDTALRKQVFAKYENRCYVCHYSRKPALRVHHIAPVDLGGQNDIDNLVLLCSNCHALTHHFGAKRFSTKDIRPDVTPILGSEAATRLAGLAQRMHKARINIENNTGAWISTKNTKAAYELAEAVGIVAQRNSFSEKDEHLLRSYPAALFSW